ncbi:MAG TPA: histidine kinase [Acidiphilium sp.]
MSDQVPSRSGVSAPNRLGRPDQLTVLGFVTDPASETVLKDGLGDLARNGTANSCDIRRGSVRTAIGAMMRMPAPQILVVDISGDDRPLQSLAELCDVIEPSVTLLVLGDIDDVDLYRAIGRRVGAADYVFKPVTREMVARYFTPLITHDAVIGDQARGGRIVAVTGARGGVGASSIACALAWFLGVGANRHTLLLDADPVIGVATEWFGIETDTPDEGADDPAFTAGAARPVRNRLSVLASTPDPGSDPAAMDGAAGRLIEAIRFRFNFIVVDLPFVPVPSCREILDFAHHRVIVTDPSIAGLRDTLRLLAIPNGAGQPQRPTILLNREKRPGGLRRKHIEDALKRKVDIAIPDMPKQFIRQEAGPFDPMPRVFGRAMLDLAREVGFEPGRSAGRTGWIGSGGAIEGRLDRDGGMAR